MITKEDFLAGKRFTYDNEYFSYSTSVECILDYANNWYSTILSINSIGFIAKRYFFNKRVEVNILFKDCQLAETSTNPANT